MALRTDQTSSTPTSGNHAADHVATNTKVNQLDNALAGGLTGQVLAKSSGSDYDTEWVEPGAASVPDATSSVKGKIQLTGDLGGTADSPTVPGLSSKQPLDTELTALAGLTSAADKVPYFTGSGTASTSTLTSFGRSLIDDADAAAGRATLATKHVYDVKAYGAVGDCITLTDGSISSGSTSFTSSGASFSSGDVGKLITISGAGASGANLNTTIAAYVSSTNVTLTASASTTVSSAYTTYGTNDRTAILNAYNAAGAAGGGIVSFPYGKFAVGSTMTFAYSNVHMIGAGIGATTIEMMFSGDDNFGGMFTFRNSASGAIVSNIRVSDMSIDMNYNAANAIALRANTSAVTNENYLFERLDIAHRGADNTASIGSIKVTGAYDAFSVGSYKNITFRDIKFHDSKATTSTNKNGFSILFLSGNAADVTFDHLTFENTYGTTIGLVPGVVYAARTRRNHRFIGCRFINTIQTYQTTAQGDISDVGALGFDGISVVDCHWICPTTYSTNPDGIQWYCMMIYQSSNFTVQSCTFENPWSVIAPGIHSGSEASYAWSFSNNVISDAVTIGDFDGHWSGIYANNVFYQCGVIQFGGYGQHRPTLWDGNLFYNCTFLVPESGANEYDYAVFVIEDGGNIIQNNVWYNDVSSGSTGAKYFIYEIDAGGPTGYDTHPNVYKNNTLLGDTNITTATFYLNSVYDHVITGNTGVIESTVQNRLTGATVTTTSLPSTDICAFNFRTNGTMTSNTPTFTGGIGLGDGSNIVVGSTTGTKIGTATTQKLGFFNATPVVQPGTYTTSNVTTDRTYDANATSIDELADVVGTLIADLKSLGIIG